MIKDCLKSIAKGQHLSYEDAYQIASAMMSDQMDPIHVSALLTGLKVKGETYQEVSGFAKGLKDHAVKFKRNGRRYYDIVGTGGDGANTFNISTTCAFVLSGAGLSIAKHGNRSISSRCGSADVLEALGVNINLNADQIQRTLDNVGLAFIFAPLAHPAMKNIMPVRKNLGIPTIFNIIGPLANPLNLEGQLIGVFEPGLVDLMANAMGQLGIKKGLVVHGAGGLDELSLAGPNTIAFLNENGYDKVTIDAKNYNLLSATVDALKGGSAEENAVITKSVLSGAKGPHRDVVLLNSAAALYAFGIAESIKDGILMAADSIDSGKALDTLNQLIQFTSLKGA